MSRISVEHAKLIRQLETIAPLDDDDRSALAALPLRLKVFGADQDIVREGERATEACVILDGFVCRYKMTAGGRRQIVSFHFPGDLPDLQSLALEVMDHSLAALTQTRVAFVAHDAIVRAVEAHSGVAAALTKHALIDGSIFREWIANVGQRPALARIAHVICECFVRMRALGLAADTSFELPLTQAEIGDATGLSNVHVNRTMQELRRQGLIAIHGKTHSILDWDQLQETADFRPSYLHLRPEFIS